MIFPMQLHYWQNYKNIFCLLSTAMTLLLRPSALSDIHLLKQLGMCILFNLIRYTKCMGTFKYFVLHLVSIAHDQLNGQIPFGLVWVVLYNPFKKNKLKNLVCGILLVIKKLSFYHDYTFSLTIIIMQLKQKHLVMDKKDIYNELHKTI